MEIRTLRADEIDVRIGSWFKEDKGAMLLLYKDARADMRILDELFGAFGWQRHHEVINGKEFCTVSIYDDKTKQWISKQDCGTESNTEKEKGQSSDAFKRACVNWGIGRELYTAPNISIYGINKKANQYSKFAVKEIEYDENRNITKLVITMDGKVVYPSNNYKGNTEPKKKQEPKKLECATCHAPVTQEIYDWGIKKYGKAICGDCYSKLAKEQSA